MLYVDSPAGVGMSYAGAPSHVLAVPGSREGAPLAAAVEGVGLACPLAHHQPATQPPAACRLPPAAETKADAHTNDTQTAADMNTFLRRWFAKFAEFQVGEGRAKASTAGLPNTAFPSTALHRPAPSRSPPLHAFLTDQLPLKRPRMLQHIAL